MAAEGKGEGRTLQPPFVGAPLPLSAAINWFLFVSWFFLFLDYFEQRIGQAYGLVSWLVWSAG